jgi:hypothetical protein
MSSPLALIRVCHHHKGVVDGSILDCHWLLGKSVRESGWEEVGGVQGSRNKQGSIDLSQDRRFGRNLISFWRRGDLDIPSPICTDRFPTRENVSTETASLESV